MNVAAIFVREAPIRNPEFDRRGAECAAIFFGRGRGRPGARRVTAILRHVGWVAKRDTRERWWEPGRRRFHVPLIGRGKPI